MEIDNETILSPPSAIQRETDITPGYPRSQVDMFRDIEISIKCLPRLTLQEAGKHTSLSRHIPRNKKRFSSYPSIMNHFIDVETPSLREAIREPVWQDSIT
jgi:hypothetical protein